MARRARSSRRRRLRRDHINRLLPNALTMLGLCAGLTAIRFSLEGRWEIAILLVAGAALLDTLDGRIARLMGGPTEFGGQLDSLVDGIAFGVAPVIMVYIWSLQDAGGIGWAVALLYPVCCVLRLARFNVASAENDLPAWANGYFSGVPAPAGAGLLLLPLILFSETGWQWLGSPWLTGPWSLTVALLMISRLPTWSFKRLRVPSKFVTVSMAGIAFLAAAMFTEPQLTLTAIIVAYGCTLPFSVRAYRRLEAEEAAQNSEIAPPPGED